MGNRGGCGPAGGRRGVVRLERVGLGDTHRADQFPEFPDDEFRQIQRRPLYPLRGDTARPARPDETLRFRARIRHGAENHRRAAPPDRGGGREGHARVYLCRDQSRERHLLAGQSRQSRDSVLSGQREQAQLPQHGALHPPADRRQAAVRRSGGFRRRKRLGRALPPRRGAGVQDRRRV